MVPAPCPCGLPEPYDACCGPLHRGGAAPTAERLMRSRYTAFSRGEAGYLLTSWHPSTRPPEVRLDPQRRWTRLDVDAATGGGLLDATGTVAFRAAYADARGPGVQRETSRFRRDERRWVYLGPA